MFNNLFGLHNYFLPGMIIYPIIQPHNALFYSNTFMADKNFVFSFLVIFSL